jgi:hypothetical protein
MSEDRAYACFLLNVLLPGTGTMLSSAYAKGGCRFDVLGIGFAQLLTAPILLFGWAWSINHGAALMDLAGVKDK